ncbi:MAG TPA: SCO family protein [Longimicrobiales bacterium]|nr:SCO family protein [Longimicrobiales bacterium]
MSRTALEEGQRLALLALGAVLLVTVGWWALALWPVPTGTPEWLSRARAVCFNAGPDGLPDVSGWMLLIGQPLGMLGFLVVVWPRELSGGVRWLATRRGGQATLAGAGVFLLAGLLGTGVRVANAAGAQAPPRLPPGMAAADHPRLDKAAPELGLVDHRGERVALADLEGRPALVTFAFGHCADICPLVVENARRARDEAWGPDGATLVVVTLDPWRDTAGRLPELARRWALGPADHMLGGDVEEVEAVLDAWNVARHRDPMTGDVAHPPLVYLLDADGTIAFATLSGKETLVGLAGRM